MALGAATPYLLLAANLLFAGAFCNFFFLSGPRGARSTAAAGERALSSVRGSQSFLAVEEPSVVDGSVGGMPMEIFPFAEDHGAACRARVGTIVYSVDETIETDFNTFFFGHPGVANYVSRMAKGPGITHDSLEETQSMLPAAAKLLPDQPYHAIGMACTSLAVTIGEDVIADLIATGANVSASQVTNPLTAAKRAFKALGVTKIAVLTPYTADITGGLVDVFTKGGFSVVRLASFNQTLDKIVLRISPQSVQQVVEQLVATSPDIEAVFVSCTDMRILPVLEEVERKTGVPLISSNTAMGWDLLRLSGQLPDARRNGPGGALFQVPMPHQGPRGPCP